MTVDAWKNFEISGRVTDYLAYKKSTESKGPEAPGQAGYSEKGMGSYGDRHNPDGDGVKCHADWRE